MIRSAVVAIAIAAAALVGAAPGQAADECQGLQTCIPVAGPWVVIQPPGGFATTASWQLVCPQGVVGGVDARANDAAVSVDFPGHLGSPVNPGITTTTSLVFRGTYAGRAPALTTYQPFIGCIPASGGGARTRVSFRPTAGVKPGEAITIRVKTLDLQASTLGRTTLTCKPRERLLASTSSVGLFTGSVIPSRAQLAAVRVIRVRRGRQILVSATRLGLESTIRAEVQVQVACAR